MTGREVAEVLSGAGFGKEVKTLVSALLRTLTNSLLPDEGKVSKVDPMQALISSMGPAATCAAIHYSLNRFTQDPRNQHMGLNGSITNNHLTLVKNDSYNASVRDFLLSRANGFSMDLLLDPRHMIDKECGYPPRITPAMYKMMYERDDVARRVNDIYPDECSAVDPLVYETEDEDVTSPFEQSWKDLCEDQNLLTKIYQLDKQCGIGHFGVMLYGIKGEGDFSKPIQEPALLAGEKRSVGTKQREILYLRCFDEYNIWIDSFEQNPGHPRYMLPEYYTLTLSSQDNELDYYSGNFGTVQQLRVHWTRLQHAADNVQGNLVAGTPRMQPVFNRLLDLRKIKGASPEMLYKGGFPGISFEIDPRFVSDDQPDFDKEAFREELRRYSEGLQRMITNVGVKAVSLAPNVSDPTPHVRIQEEAIASHQNVPFRVWKGSEEGRLASSQDKVTWNQRLKRRLTKFSEPTLIRGVVDRFVAIGVMPPPSKNPNKRYFVSFGDLNVVADEDKANLSLKETQALSQYVASGVIHFISPVDYMTTVLRWPPAKALKIDKYIQGEGGYTMLKKVDPSVGAGANGNSQNIAKKEDNATSQAKPAQRQTADKQAEGKTS